MTDEDFTILRRVADDVVLVSEDSVKDTVKRLALGNRIVVAPSGALPVTAALATPDRERGRTVCVITGGSNRHEHTGDHSGLKSAILTTTPR